MEHWWLIRQLKTITLDYFMFLCCFSFSFLLSLFIPWPDSAISHLISLLSPPTLTASVPFIFLFFFISFFLFSLSNNKYYIKYTNLVEFDCMSLKQHSNAWCNVIKHYTHGIKFSSSPIQNITWKALPKNTRSTRSMYGIVTIKNEKRNKEIQKKFQIIKRRRITVCYLFNKHY